MKRLFVLIRDKLGDTVIAFQGLAAYRAMHPQDEITVMVHAHYLPLIEHEPGYRFVPYTSSLQAMLWAWRQRLFGRPYDALLVLRGFGKKVGSLARILHAKKRIHFLSRMPDIFQESPPALLPEEDARQTLIAPVVRALWQVSPGLSAPQALVLPSLSARRTQPCHVVVCPVTDEARKNISPAAVAAMLPGIRRRHPGMPIRILVRTDGEQGFEAGKPILGAEVVAFGSISGLLRELGEAATYYGADTGLYHVAAAMGIPAVVFFGPTQPYKVMLPGQNACAVRLQALGQDHCDMKGCRTPVCLQNAIALWSAGSLAASRYPEHCSLRLKETPAEIMEVRPAQFAELV
jgi:ADP-heptose:LPS heptosyltransferase